MIDIVITIVLLVALVKWVRDPKALAIILVAFGARMSLVFYGTYIGNLPGAGIDTVYFYNSGVASIITNPMEVFRYFELGSRMYIWFLGLLFSVFGESEYVAKAINAFLGTLVVYNSMRAIALLGGRKTAIRFGVVLSLWPTLILYSSLLLRDSFVIYFASIGVLNMVRWSVSRANIRVVFASIAFLLATSLHTGMILTLPASALFMSYVIFSERRRYSSKRAKGVVAVIMLGSFFAVALLAGVGLQKFRATDQIELETVVEQQVGAARSRTAYLQGKNVQGATDIVIQTPVRLIYFFFSPFPWKVSAVSDVFGALDALFFVILMVIAVVRMRKDSGNVVRRGLCLLFLLSSIAFALGTSNYGTALRHRAKMLPFIVVFALPVRIDSSKHSKAR